MGVEKLSYQKGRLQGEALLTDGMGGEPWPAQISYHTMQGTGGGGDGGTDAHKERITQPDTGKLSFIIC